MIILPIKNIMTATKKQCLLLLSTPECLTAELIFGIFSETFLGSVKLS